VGNKEVLDADGKRKMDDEKSKEINEKVKKAEDFQDQLKKPTSWPSAPLSWPWTAYRSKARGNFSATIPSCTAPSCSRPTVRCAMPTPSRPRKKRSAFPIVPGRQEGDLQVFGSRRLGNQGVDSRLIENPADPKFFGLNKLEGMKKWRKGVEKDRKKASKDAIAKETRTSTRLPNGSLSSQAKPKARPQVEEERRNLFLDTCGTCHRFGKDGGETAPDLAGYGSQEWLRFMIMSPAANYATAKKTKCPPSATWMVRGGSI